MADNRILHRVSLEGAEKVAKQLESIGIEGEKAFKKVKTAADGASSVGNAGGPGFGGLGKTEQSAAAAERLREILHTLHPILSTAGIELGELGAFSRVAGAGMGALGVAIVGSLLIGLAKVAEQADKTKRRLDLLSGAGKGGGESQFEGLKKTASELGADPSDLAPVAESLFRSQQNSRAANRTVIHPDNFVAGENEQAADRVQVFRGADATPTGGVSNETINAAIKASAEAGRLDRTSAKDSAAALAGLYESTKGGKGQVTVDAYDALAKVSPAIAEAIAKAAAGSGAGGVGQGLPAGAPDLRAFLQRGGKLTGDQVLTGLARTEPDLREKGEAVPPGITESFDHLEAAAKRLTEAFAGDVGIAGAVEKFAKVVDGAADNIDKTIHPRDYEPGGPKFVGPVSPEEKKQYNKPTLVDIGKTLLTGESDERFKDSNAIKATKFLRDGPEFLQGPVSEPLDVLNKIVNNPGALQSPERPEASGPVSPATAPFAAVPFQKLQQRELELQRLRDLPQQRNQGGQPESEAPAAASPAAPVAAPASPAVTSPDLDTTPLYRPLNGPAKSSPEFDYIPPPTPDQQRQLDLDRLRGPQQPSQQLPFPPPPQFDRTNFGQAEPANPAVQPVSYQPPLPLQQGALPPQPPSIVQDVAGFVQNIVNSASEKLNGPENRKIETPAATIGIRGEAAPVGDDAVTRQVAGLGAAAEEAAAKLRGVEAPARSETPVAHAATGGHIRGPGTGTSDSIPAMLSDGEYVVKAAAVKRVGVDKLDAMNAGHYADGGEVQKTGPRPDNNESGVIEASDGNYYPYHNKAEKDDILRGLDKANADAQSSQGKKKHHSMFHPENNGAGAFGFAAGGLVGNAPSRLQSMIRGFANGGIIDVPHLAIGGMPEMPAAMTSADSSSFSSKPAPSAMEHWGTLDLRSDHGDHRIATERDTMKHLNASAQSAKRTSTGSKPGWYGGRGG